MADKFKFLVGAGLQFKNMIFEAIDSVIDPTLDSSFCLSSSGICCSFSGTTLTGAASCVYSKTPDEECVGNLGMSFIEFDIHSQSMLIAGSPPTLTIIVISWLNILEL